MTKNEDVSELKVQLTPLTVMLPHVQLPRFWRNIEPFGVMKV